MGKTKSIETPDKLLQLFVEYMNEVSENPILVHDFVGKDGDSVYRKKQRPLTWVSFERFLYNSGVINDLGDYESNKDNRYADYATIITRIKKFIEADQFEGAIAGIYNPNIIARKLGLADKQELKVDSFDITLKL